MSAGIQQSLIIKLVDFFCLFVFQDAFNLFIYSKVFLINQFLKHKK